MSAIIILVIFVIVIGFPSLYLLVAGKLFLYGWRRIPPRQIARRMGTVAALALALCAPYLAFKTYELCFVLARVPEPLNVAWIDYRREKMGGIGGPGDQETGFIAYRLRQESAEWARSKGAHLAASLAHQRGESAWLPTPVDDKTHAREWHDSYSDRNRAPHPADIAEYLDRYGFGIRVERRWLDQANQAIRQPGSFYRYDRGGRVTIIDPAAGYVYVAYAG